MNFRQTVLSRTLVTLFNGVFIAQPLFASLATAQVITDPNAPATLQADVTTNQNGVPLVNIAAPNSNGLSHNQYQSFSVNDNNLILNNSNQTVNTIVGGEVNANPNLSNGTASIILNEVTGTDRSSLEGYTEIAGDQAELIIANPNGITCDGCGFINTPRAVLTTGTPQITNQQLMSLSVNQGDILIEGDGVNTGNVDQFDLITRSATINATVLANNLNIIAGQNAVDYASLDTTAQTNGTTAPSVAIDSSALGGMYANTIRLVGTESGVGVNLDGEMATNTGDITLSADGTVSVNTAVANQDLSITSINGGVSINDIAYGDSVAINAQTDINNDGTIAAVNSVSQSATTITNNGDVIAGLNTDSTLNAGADVELVADSVVNTGQIIATENTSIDASVIDNTGIVEAIAGNVVLDNVTELSNSDGSVQAGADISITIDEFDAGLEQNLQAEQSLIINTGDFTNADSFTTDSNVVLNLSGDFDNTGTFSSAQGYSITANNISNGESAGLITDGTGSLVASNGDIDNAGVISAADDLSLSASGSILNQNVIGSGNDLTLIATDNIENSNGLLGSLLFSVGDMNLLSNQLINRYSDIYAVGDITIAGNANGDANNYVLNSSSLLEAGGDVTINTQLFENRRDPVTSFDNTSLCASSSDSALCNGTVLGGDSFGVPINTPLSQAWLFAEALNIRASGLSQEEAYVAGQNILNQLYLAAIRTPTVYAGNDINITAGGFLNQGGLLSAANNINVTANDVVNETLVAATLGPGGYNGPSVMNIRHFFNADGSVATDRGLLGSYLSSIITLPNTPSPIVLNVGAAPDFRVNTLPIVVTADGNILIPGNNSVASPLLLSNGQLQVVDFGGGENNGTVNISDSQIDDYITRDEDGSYQLVLGDQVYSIETGPTGNMIAQFDADNLPIEFAVTAALSDYSTTAQSNVTFEPYDLPYISQIVDTTFFPAQLQAGNAINITATNTLNNGVNQTGSVTASTPPTITIPEAVVSSETTPESSIGSDVFTDINDDAFDALDDAIPAASDFTQIVVDTTVPSGGGGLFTASDNGEFLVATNATVANFIDSFGTDYLLEQLNYQPDEFTKRLGDNFYESYLIRQAVMAQTGRRFVHSSLRSDQQQFRYFMDNAVVAQQALDLSIGVRLTPAQVASLTHDMVWLEEQTINGQRVLVPTLYLATVRDDDIGQNGLIAARNISLSSGTFNNTGAITSSKRLAIDIENNFSTRSQLTAGDSLSIRAGQDITATNATLQSGGDLSLSSGRDTTLSSTRVEADGNANMSVGNNFTLNSERDQQGNASPSQPSSSGNAPSIVKQAPLSPAELDQTIAIKSVPKRSLGGTADRRIINDNTAVASSSSEFPVRTVIKAVPSTSNTGQSNTTQATANVQGSELSVGGDLNIDVGNNMLLSGSSIDARGDAFIDVDGNFTSRQGRAGSQRVSASASPATRAVLETTDPRIQSRRLINDNIRQVSNPASTVLVRGNLASLVAGGNLTLVTGEGINAGGTRITSETGNTNLIAESGDIVLRANQIRSANETTIVADNGNINSGSNQILAGGGITQRASGDMTSANDRVLATGSVVQQALGNINQSGGSISAGDSITQLADGTIHNTNALLAAESGNVAQQAGGDLTQTNARINAGNDITQLSGGDISNRGEQNSTTGGSLTAGNAITTIAQGDLTLDATQITAGDNVTLAGDNVELGVITTRESSSSRTGSKRNRVTTRNETVRNQGAEINSGGDVIISAEQDLNITSGVVNADNNIALNAGGDTLITAVQDEDYSYYKKVKKKKWGRKTTRTTESLRTTNIESELNAGGNVTINSRINPDGSISSGDSGAVTIQGSLVNAGQQVAVSGDGVSVLSQTEIDYLRKQKTKRGFGGLSSSSNGRVTREQVLQASQLNALSEDLSLLSGGNITIMGSDVISGGDINLVAVDDIMISAQVALTETKEWSRESRFNPISTSNIYEREDSIEGQNLATMNASTLDAQGDVNLDGSRITIAGSDVVAGEDINANTDVGDIRILSAQQVLNSYNKQTSASATMEDVIEQQVEEIEEILDVKTQIEAIGTDEEKNQATTSITQVQYDQVDTRNQTIDNRASQLIANGNINLNAAGDIDVQGSDLVGDADADQTGDINLQAGGDVNITESGNVSDTQTDEVHGSGELSAVVQHQAVEIVQAAKAVEEAKDKVKDAKEDYREYQKDLRNLKQQRDKLADDYANEVPGISYEDILELDGIIDDAESDEDWYKAGVVLAAANLASKVTLLVQQSVAGAASVGTWGFNAGVQLDLDASKTETENHQETSRGSTLAANNIRIATGEAGDRDGTRTLIQGSHLAADNLIQVTTGDLDIEASRDNSNNRSDTESAHIRIAQTLYGAAGGPTISVDYQRSRTRDGSTSFNNSTLNAENIDLTSSNNTTIKGANIDARDTLSLDVGNDLLVQSQQDRYNAKNNSIGVSAGASFSGGQASSVSGGLNASNGSTRVRETVLTTVTGETVDIDVGNNTAIVGATIAATDDEGNDNGQLSLSTQSLDFVDLSNTANSNQRGVGIRTNVTGGTGSNSLAQGMNTLAGSTGGSSSVSTDNQSDAGKTTLSYSNDSSHSKTKTLATVGQGTLTVRDDEETGKDSTTRLNRDIDGSERDIYDIDTPAIDLELEVDNQLISNVVSPVTNYLGNQIEAMGVDLTPELQADLAQSGEQAVDALIRQGYSAAEANQFLQDHPQLMTTIAGLQVTREALENGVSLESESGNSSTPSNNGNSTNIVITGQGPTILENGVMALGEGQRYLDHLYETNPIAAQMATVAINAATGGPVKAAISEGLNQTINAIVGEEIEATMGTVTAYGGTAVTDDSESVDEFAQTAQDSDSREALIRDGVRFGVETLMGVGGIRNGPGKVGADSDSVPNGTINTNAGGANLGPEGSTTTPKVTAEAEVDGVKFNDTNQGSRPPEAANPNTPTLIADDIQIKIDKNNRDFPNGNMATAHAEIGAIQQAFDAGKTQGNNMTMRVAGEDVCDYCRSDLRKAADKSGLNSLSVYEETTGRTLTWTRREDGSMGKVKITEPEGSK